MQISIAVKFDDCQMHASNFQWMYVIELQFHFRKCHDVHFNGRLMNKWYILSFLRLFAEWVIIGVVGLVKRR